MRQYCSTALLPCATVSEAVLQYLGGLLTTVVASCNVMISLRRCNNTKCYNMHAPAVAAATASCAAAELPPTVVVLDVSENGFTGGLPKELPNSLYAFNADDNKLSGPLPVLTEASLMHFLQLGNNSLTGPLPISYINNVSTLIYLDLSSNKLSGSLLGSSSSSGTAGGRKLLQQPLSGPWSLPQLTYLDLSENQFAGVPRWLGWCQADWGAAVGLS